MKSSVGHELPSRLRSSSAPFAAGTLADGGRRCREAAIQSTFATEFSVIFCDGTASAWRRGHYWRMKIGGVPGGWGLPHGPFATEEFARADADLYFHNQVSRIVDRVLQPR